MNLFKGLFRIFRFGVKSSYTEFTKNQIINFNIDLACNVVVALIFELLFISKYSGESLLITIAVILQVITAAISIYLNINRHPKYATLLTTLTTLFGIVFIGLYYGEITNVHYLLMVASVTPFIHLINHLRLAIGIFVAHLVCYVILLVFGASYDLETGVIIGNLVNVLIFPLFVFKGFLILKVYLSTSENLLQRQLKSKESEAVLNSVVQNSQDFIWAIDKDLTLIAYNEIGKESFKKFFGIEVHLGKSLKNVLSPKDQKNWEVMFYRAFKGQTSTIFPELLHEGILKSFAITYSPLKDQKKQIIGCSVFVKNVTKLKKAEEKRKESKRKYKYIFENSNQGIVVVDYKSGKIVDCNQRALSIFGTTEKTAFFARPLASFIAKQQPHGISSSMVFKQAIERLRKHERLQLEGRGQRFDGTFFESEIVVIRDFNKERRELIFFISDITERKSRYKAIQLISEGISKTKGNNFLDDLALSFANVFDIPYVYIAQPISKREKVHSLTFVDHGKVVDNFVLPLSKYSPSFAFYTGRPEPIIYPDFLQEIFPNNKAIKNINAQSFIGVPLLNEKRKVIGHITALDTKPLSNPEITKEIMMLYSARIVWFLEQMKTQAALRESEERYRLLYESGFDGIMIFDLKRKIPVSGNKKLSEFFGYTFKEMGQLRPSDLMPTKQPDGARSLKLMNEYAREVLENGKKKFEWLNIRKDRMPFYSEISAFQLPAPNQHLCLAIFKNITEQKEAEEALAQKMEEINEKNTELERYIDSNMQLENFAYVASHDMKEPLRTIVSFSQILSRRYKNKLDEAGKEYIDFIIAATKNMSNLINDLLTYSKVNTEDYELEPINLPELIGNIEYSLNQIIMEKNAIIEVKRIPSIIHADYFRMLQLFQNLISNGIKFHKPDSIPIVTIDCKEEKRYWKFSIKDNGIGIKDEFFDKIFLIFKRLHGKQAYEGTGIGLALCKRIVEQFGGKIWIESKKGVGTTFYFTIKK